MKKSCFLLLFAVLTLFAACGRDEQPQTTSAQPTTEYMLDAESLLGAQEVAQHDCEVHGHVFSRATCLRKSACFYCGEETGELAAHDWTHATCLTRSTCTVCGAQTGDLAAHRFTQATCAGRASCAVCGVTTGDLPAHRFRGATCVSPSMCTVCMKKQGSALGHQWTGGSCTESQVCTRCKRTLAAPGHRMQGGSCTQDGVCTVCGYTEKAKGHQYVDDVCTVCGKTRQQAVREDEMRTTQPSTEVETTLPALDTEPLAQYAAAMRTHLQTAHDEADSAVSAEREAGRELAQSAVEHLRQALDAADEADALCKTDARLRSVSDAIDDVRKTVRESAGVSTIYDDSYIQTVVTIRGDSSKGLQALSAVDEALKKLEKTEKE